MDNLKQTETVKKELELDVHIANEESKLEALRAQQYPDAPKPPVRETAHKEYPKIIPQVEFNWALAVCRLYFSCLGFLFIILQSIRTTRRRNMNESRILMNTKRNALLLTKNLTESRKL